jgi:two-component system OmpR family response regulator
MRILLAEDDLGISGMVSKHLEAAGYLPDVSTDGPDAWERGEVGDYAAIILYLGLPGMDGLSILKRWRQAGVETPVLVLTARGSWMERVDGFDAGADDYLPKPFRTEELLARLRALLRRSQSRAPAAISSGRFSLDEAAKRILFDGEPIDVSPMEYRLIAYLASRKGQSVPAIELANHVQGREDDTAKNAVEAMVARLRKKTAADAIQNRRGFGYLLPEEAP